MKVEDFAYQVVQRTIALLEELHHYKVTDEARKEIVARIKKEVPALLKQS